MSENNDFIKLYNKVLNKIKEHALSEYNKNKSEVIGFLIGNFKKNFIEIKDIVIPEQKSTNIHAEILNEISLIDYLEKNKFKKVQVGWYHSHPNFGCFLSDIDITTQKNWQKVNNRMVAIVIDPIQDKIKAFRLDKDGNVENIPIKIIK